MSRPMTTEEFFDLLQEVQAHHSPFCNVPVKHFRVKYIDPVFDMRTRTVFAITFRGYGTEVTLHCQNECRDLKETLYERCIALLKGEA